MVALHILHNIFVCSESDSSKQKCFNTMEIASPVFLTKGLISSTVFFYMFFQNMHWQYALAIRSGMAESENFRGGGGAECTGGDGRVCCIYHTRHGVRQNDRFIAIILFS